jgi:predicted MFS family arabinose efflux permease
VTVVFFALGATAASWASRLPAIKDGLDLSPGLLGVILLGPAIGSLLAMPLTGKLLRQVSPRRVVQVAFVPLAVLLPLAGVAGSPWQLFANLAAWGAAAGVVDVAMNTEAAALQDRLGRRVMSGFHGTYSAGGLAGAGLGALAAATGVDVRAHLLVAASVVLVAGLAASQRFAATSGSSDLSSPRLIAGRGTSGIRPWWTLVALSAVAFGCFLAEGAANDWSAVYLHSSLGAPAGLAAISYSLFAAAMMAGRLNGDRLADRWGAAHLIRLSAGVAAIGFATALLVSEVAAGLAGFTVLGLGLSVVVPLVFTAAAQLGQAGPSLAVVAGSGYAGFLVGPALIGGLADAVGLPPALGVVAAVSAITALLAPVVAPQPSPGSPADPALKACQEVTV